MSLTRKQQKIIALISCFLSDLTLMAWLYFMATNYQNYGQMARDLDSPDFQIQLYKVVLQSLTFFLMAFTLTQTVVYILAARNFRAALLYLKFFSVLGFAAFLGITLIHSSYAILPMFIYLFGYYVFSKLFKESSAVAQTLPQ